MYTNKQTNTHIYTHIYMRIGKSAMRSAPKNKEIKTKKVKPEQTEI